MSWAPIEFERWHAFAIGASFQDQNAAANLRTAITRVDVSWSRLRQDLLDLFLPSGPEGTHAHHHYHAPSDPTERRRVISATIADYEAALTGIDVALELSAEVYYPGTKDAWKKKMLKAAELSNATNFDRAVLYLQRTPQWSRNYAIVHPLNHVTCLHFDHVGNAMWVRQRRDDPDPAVLADLDTLLHQARGEMDPTKYVGGDIDPAMALTWTGSVAGTLSEHQRKAFESARKELTFWLPYPHEVASYLNTFIGGLIAQLPESDFKTLVFGGSPSQLAALSLDDVPEPKVGPVDWDDELEAIAGDPEKELELFERYLKDFPDNPGLLNNIGVAKYRLGHHEEAIEAFTRAAAVGGMEPDLAKSLADSHYNIGAREYNFGNFEVALGHYRRAVELNPTDVQSMAHLIVATARDGRVTEALTIGAGALMLYPKNPEILYNVALTLAFAERHEEALDYAKRLLQDTSDHKPAQKLVSDLSKRPTA